MKKIKPSVRLAVARVKTAAMTDGLQPAANMLQELSSNDADSELDQLVLGLVESEIYFLDLRYDRAIDIFTAKVEPFLELVDPRIAAVIADNKCTIQMAKLEPLATDIFYHLVDQRRILGVEIVDHAARLEAISHATEKKHFRAAPISWQLVQRAYHYQNWRAMATAEEDFAQECLSLEWMADAAYHAMMSRREDAMKDLAKGLMARKSATDVRDVLRKLLPTSTLAAHAIQVARLIAATADGIPDDLIGDVSRWLAQWAAEGFARSPLGVHVEPVWQSIANIACRLDDKQSQRFAETALGHELFRTPSMHRRHLIEALFSLCPRLTNGSLFALKDAALSLVGPQKHDIDYVASMNLLLHVVHCGGSDMRNCVREQLVPQGVEIKDTILLHAANTLGWKPLHPETFSKSATAIAGAVERQVQRLAPGEEPAKIGAVCVVTSESPSGRIVVHMAGAINAIESLIVYRNILDDDSLRRLISAILAMILEPDNVISNRAQLVKELCKFVDALPSGLENQITASLEPLAAGNIVESPIGQTYAQSIDTLNAFKMGAGNPVELRGAALTALGAIEKHRPQIKTKLHEGLLMRALTAQDAELRRQGLIAAESCSKLNHVESTTIAIAALDRDDKVAARALRVLYGIRNHLNLDKATEQIILRALELAITSQDAIRRHNAAALVKVLPTKDMTSDSKQRMETIVATLRQDFCHPVRSVLNSTPLPIELTE
ncbi:MAG: hypothetical protein HKL96_05410 [Phycisphaerales bacterium]|nr:hypothetical protein [Phycisphaerales bacterium]